MREQARARRETTHSTIVLSVEEYMTKLKRRNPIQPHEIVRFIGLLIARSLEPRRESLSRHWITKVEGALSCGTFGQFISRDRFHDIARYLHFNDNTKHADSGDRAFKIRPVIQALQKTFSCGYLMGARISFDEGMVQMRHRRNPTCRFMPMKPNKWGTKFYLTPRIEAGTELFSTDDPLYLRYAPQFIQEDAERVVFIVWLGLKSTAGRRTLTRRLLHNVLWSRIFCTCSEVSLLNV